VAWIRAQDAVPRRDTGAVDKPVMSSSQPMDLVQDAATDCSVVASLCAAVARHERGYEKVCVNPTTPCFSITNKTRSSLLSCILLTVTWESRSYLPTANISFD
jgi:hypothetical protein